jgi:predicted nucleic-acid-binding protein
VIALDTNVVVRFLVEDAAAQTERARELLQRVVRSQASCFVSDVVMCEVVWVLERSYKFRRVEISQALGRLLRAAHLTFLSTERLAGTLEAYETGGGGFADYLIREHARAHGCEAVATFNGDLLKEPGFVAP